MNSIRNPHLPTQRLLSAELVRFGLVLIVVVVAEWLGLLQGVRGVSERLVQPLMVGVAKLQWVVWQPVRAVQYTWNAAARVQELEQRYSESTATVALLSGVEAENKALRELLDAQTRPQHALIATPVTSYGTPSVSVGADDGVLAGMPVLAQGTLVGRISELTPRQSSVQLLSQRMNSSILARTSKGAEGLVQGDGKRILLTEVEPSATVEPGEIVTSIGESGIAPDLVIGRVQYKLSSETAATQTFVVEQVVSFYEVPIVMVVVQ